MSFRNAKPTQIVIEATRTTDQETERVGCGWLRNMSRFSYEFSVRKFFKPLGLTQDTAEVTND